MKPVVIDGVPTPICPHCISPGELVETSYGHRWECPEVGCDARVGVHKLSKLKAPLGVMARLPLRLLRIQCHEAFDPLWRGSDAVFNSRNLAYAWLAGAIGVSVNRCHFGEFDEATCARALSAIASYLEAP